MAGDAAMSRYTSGRAKEYQAIAELKRRGASLVVRSAGSKGLADLVAVFGAVVWLVQVKYVTGARSWQDANWRKLQALKRPASAMVYAMVYRRGRVKPALMV
jgi:Holliday junction resolvase-like predicted endonuclease